MSTFYHPEDIGFVCAEPAYGLACQSYTPEQVQQAVNDGQKAWQLNEDGECIDVLLGEEQHARGMAMINHGRSAWPSGWTLVLICDPTEG